MAARKAMAIHNEIVIHRAMAIGWQGSSVVECLTKD